MKRINKPILAWACYDWANSAFATTVLAGFFPLFFKEYWNSGVDAALSTFRLGMANSIASLIVVLLAPILGAIADAGGAKKRFLLTLAYLGVLATATLMLVERGEWVWAVACYSAGLIGFSGSIVFSDALIVDVAEEKERHFVSGLGYALGYLGGGILFAINVCMTLWPQIFGLTDATQAVRVSFITVALWWAMFSLPVMLFVREKPVPRQHGNLLSLGFHQLIDTFHEIRHLRMVGLFLAGYWLYIDGVDTIVRMAVDYGLAIGLDSQSLIIALLITQFVGFPAAIGFGLLGERIGAKSGIYLAIAVYILVTVWAYFMNQTWEFFAMAITIGLVQGGIQALSRSLYSELIPPQKAAEFFGFYNMLGKFAAVIGPMLMGGIGLLTGSPRYAILSIIVLFLAGAFFLRKVDVQQGRKLAATL